MSRLIDMRDTLLDALEVEQAVAHPGAGAVVSFIGRVRDHNDGKPVTRLEYEAYPSMAIKEMTHIVSEIEQRLPGTRLGVVHRIGSLDVGEAAIIAAASAAHRSEAFEACRILIDEVKSRAPIWKREHGPGGPCWIGWEDARCRHHHCPSPAKIGRPALTDLRVICITVSDTRDLDSDEAGAVAEKLLSDAGARIERRLVRDESPQIAAIMAQWLATSPDAVLLTGGTGIGPRDVTYDALLPLLELQLDGFGETFRRLSFEQIGTRALLSRAIGGTIGQTLVFAVPGSPKAVRLALEQLIIPLLPHARSMLEGGGH